MKSLALIILAMFLTGCGFEIVDPGYRGIETNLGKVVGEPLAEGLHFYNPLTSDIKEFNVRQETWSANTSIFTKDTQRVELDFAVTYTPDPKSVTKIYLEVGRENDLVEKIIKPVVLGSLKDAIGQVIADELVSKREIITKAALKEVQENLASKNVFITDLQFTNLDFDDAYEQAVEQKVVATQMAQKAKNDTVTIQEQAKQTVATAQAEAESMRIKSAALSQNKGLVEFEIAKKWDGKLPVYMMGSSVPLIDFSKIGKY
jgi:regulator of protease activity HflC (stomatin/prohibitin superfamily)